MPTTPPNTSNHLSLKPSLGLDLIDSQSSFILILSFSNIHLLLDKNAPFCYLLTYMSFNFENLVLYLESGDALLDNAQIFMVFIRNIHNIGSPVKTWWGILSSYFLFCVCAKDPVWASAHVHCAARDRQRRWGLTSAGRAEAKKRAERHNSDSRDSRENLIVQRQVTGFLQDRVEVGLIWWNKN